MEGYEGVAVMRGGPPPNGGLRGVMRSGGRDWGLFFLNIPPPSRVVRYRTRVGVKGGGPPPLHVRVGGEESQEIWI